MQLRDALAIEQSCHLSPQETSHMVDFNKMAQRARILSVEKSAGREFIRKIHGEPLEVATLTSTAYPRQWSHADTDRLAKFFGFASRMHDLLEALHREAQLHGKGNVEVATLLKEIDAACFND